MLEDSESGRLETGAMGIPCAIPRRHAKAGASALFVVVEEVLVAGPTAAFSLVSFFAPRQRKFSN